MGVYFAERCYAFRIGCVLLLGCLYILAWITEKCLRNSLVTVSNGPLGRPRHHAWEWVDGWIGGEVCPNVAVSTDTPHCLLQSISYIWHFYIWQRRHLKLPAKKETPQLKK